MPIPPTEPEASRSLAGVRVVVTRPAHQAEGLCRAFSELGAVVERLPLLEVTPPEDPAPLERAVAALHRFDWVAFTSSNAVAPVLDLLEESGSDWPSGVRVASVGSATAGLLRSRGVEPALFTSAGGKLLGNALVEGDPDLPGSRVLLPQAPDARPELAAILRDGGATVETVVAYDKALPAGTQQRAGELFPPTSTLGWVTFTSPRIARTFAALIDELVDGGSADMEERGEGGWEHRRRSLLAASIGPTTSAALAELGVEAAAEAKRPGDRELAAAVSAAVAGRGKHRP